MSLQEDFEKETGLLPLVDTAYRDVFKHDIYAELKYVERLGAKLSGEKEKPDDIWKDATFCQETVDILLEYSDWLHKNTSIIIGDSLQNYVAKFLRSKKSVAKASK